MKVAFDENVPIVLVRVFQTFAGERKLRRLSGSLIVHSAKDYLPQPGEKGHGIRGDTPWIEKFAAAGGKVIISGNTRMRQVPHERLALVNAGMIVIFFESRWNSWDFFKKCALLLHWWPNIVKKLKTAKPKEFWCVPCSWGEKGTLRRLSSDDQKLLKIEREKAAGEEIRKARALKRAARALEAVNDEGGLLKLMHREASADTARPDQQAIDGKTETTINPNTRA